MTTITTASHPKALWPGVKKFWGMEYPKHEKLWTRIFESFNSDQAWEEDVETVGFGLMSVKKQGQSITYDTAHQGYVSRYTNLTYSLGYMVTMEELMDNLYEKVSFKRVSRLARSVWETEEVVHFNVLNRAFDSTYVGGDGKELCATDHPSDSGAQSNELTVAADLSEASIEDLCIQIMNATDSRGLRFLNRPKKLIVPTSLYFDAKRIVNSTLQNDTANNAVNVIKSEGVFEEIVCSPYLTDQDAWFIQTDCPDGLTHYTRMPVTFDKDNDFDTRNLKAAAIARWSQGWSNWRGIFGSSGA